MLACFFEEKVTLKYTGNDCMLLSYHVRVLEWIYTL